MQFWNSAFVSTKQHEDCLVSSADAALRQIKNHKNKKKQNLEKIHNLCTRNHIRATIGGRPTNTQQLLYHLNRSVLRHDWEAVATCIHFLLDLNGVFLPVIWKAVVLLLFNHKKSCHETFEHFMQMCIGIRTDVDKVKFLQELLSPSKDLSIYNKKKTTKEMEDLEFNWDYSTEEEDM